MEGMSALQQAELVACRETSQGTFVSRRRRAHNYRVCSFLRRMSGVYRNDTVDETETAEVIVVVERMGRHSNVTHM